MIHGKKIYYIEIETIICLLYPRIFFLTVFQINIIKICSQKDRHHLLYVLRQNRFESQLISGTLELSTDTEKLSQDLEGD